MGSNLHSLCSGLCFHALGDHADGGTAQTEEVSDSLQSAEVDANGGMDLPVSVLLVVDVGEERIEARARGEPLAAGDLPQRLVIGEERLQPVDELISTEQDAAAQLGLRVDTASLLHEIAVGLSRAVRGAVELLQEPACREELQRFCCPRSCSIA